MPEPSVQKVRDVHLLTRADEKTVVLSRERFAADNRRPVRFVYRQLSLQNPSSTVHVYPYITPAENRREWPIYTIADDRGKNFDGSNFPFLDSRLEILPTKSRSSRGNGVYTTVERKLRFAFPKYKYYTFDIPCC